MQNPVVGCKGQQQQSCDRYVCEVELLSVAFSGEVHYRARTEDVVEHANGAQGSSEWEDCNAAGLVGQVNCVSWKPCIQQCVRGMCVRVCVWVDLPLTPPPGWYGPLPPPPRLPSQLRASDFTAWSSHLPRMRLLDQWDNL